VVGLALGAAQFAPDRLGLQHLDARLERADRIGQFARRFSPILILLGG
jgi:hypothetical protein